MLAQWVPGGKGVKLGDQRAVTAELEIRVDTGLDRLQPELLEAGDLPGGQRVVREVGHAGPRHSASAALKRRPPANARSPCTASLASNRSNALIDLSLDRRPGRSRGRG